MNVDHKIQRRWGWFRNHKRFRRNTNGTADGSLSHLPLPLPLPLLLSFAVSSESKFRRSFRLCNMHEARVAYVCLCDLSRVSHHSILTESTPGSGGNFCSLTFNQKGRVVVWCFNRTEVSECLRSPNKGKLLCVPKVLKGKDGNHWRLLLLY